MADIDLFKKRYAAFESTFKDTSFDDANNISVCQDESQSVINFDKLIEYAYPNSNERPKSFDAIYIEHNVLFCIEFKNQKPSNISNKEVQGKIEEGKQALKRLFGMLHIPTKEYVYVYCVVYPDCKEPYDRYKCGIAKESVLFGLKTYEEKKVVDKVYTQNVSFFTKQFQKQLQKDLAC